MPESPVPLREDAQVLPLMVTADSYICSFSSPLLSFNLYSHLQVLNFLADGRVEHIEHGGQKEDPLLNLFKPPKGNLRGQ